MQNNDLIGYLVLSKAGYDKNNLYVVVGGEENKYLLLADGKSKTITRPKKKNIKHVDILECINEDLKLSILRPVTNTDLEIKRFIKLKGIVKEG